MVLVVVARRFRPPFFLFRFYFVDGVVTKLLVQYRGPASGRICEDGLIERRFAVRGFCCGLSRH